METRENLTRENTSKIITTKDDERMREKERERDSRVDGDKRDRIEANE